MAVLFRLPAVEPADEGEDISCFRQRVSQGRSNCRLYRRDEGFVEAEGVDGRWSMNGRWMEM